MTYALGPHSARVHAGHVPRRCGDTPIPSHVLDVSHSAHRGGVVTPAGFIVELPTHSPVRARGLKPLPDLAGR